MATKHVFCRIFVPTKDVFVATNVCRNKAFVATKIMLVAALANDTSPLIRAAESLHDELSLSETRLAVDQNQNETFPSSINSFGSLSSGRHTPVFRGFPLDCVWYEKHKWDPKRLSLMGSFVFPTMSVSVCLSVCLLSRSVSISPCLCLSACLPVSVSVCLSVCLSVSLSLSLSLSLSSLSVCLSLFPPPSHLLLFIYLFCVKTDFKVLSFIT